MAGEVAPRRRSRRTFASAIAAYAVAAVWLNRGVWLSGHPGGRLPIAQRSDAQQEIWFLGFAAHALAHLSNPFATSLMYGGRGGINVLANTSELAIGVPFATVTWLLGPIVTYNLVTLLAPIVTATVTYVAVGPVLTRPAARFLCAGFFAFAPAVVLASVGGHLMVTLLVYPPIVFAIAVDLLVTKRRPPRQLGVALGVATVVQFFIGTEVLALTTVTVAVACVVAWVGRHPTPVPWPAILRCVATASAVAGVALAYPLWFALVGPQHVVGPPWPIIPFAHHRPGQIVSSIHGGAVTSAGGVAHGLNTAFLGWPVLALAAVVVALVRRRLVVVVATTGFVGWLLSLGAPVDARGFVGTLTHPMVLLSRVHPFDAAMAGRFDLVVSFAAAILLGIGVEAGLDRAARRTSAPARTRRLAAVAVVGVAWAATLPIVSAYDAPAVSSIHEPWWLAARAASFHPAGPVLLVPTYETLMWHAASGFPFDLNLGYAIVPSPTSDHALSFSPTDPLTALVESASLREKPSRVNLNAVTAPVARSLLSRWHTADIVLLTRFTNAGLVAANLTATIGALPASDHGVLIWRDVPALLRNPMPEAAPSAIEACAARWRHGASYAVACVADDLHLR